MLTFVFHGFACKHTIPGKSKNSKIWTLWISKWAHELQNLILEFIWTPKISFMNSKIVWSMTPESLNVIHFPARKLMIFARITNIRQDHIAKHGMAYEWSVECFWSRFWNSSKINFYMHYDASSRISQCEDFQTCAMHSGLWVAVNSKVNSMNSKMNSVNSKVNSMNSNPFGVHMNSNHELQKCSWTPISGDPILVQIP